MSFQFKIELGKYMQTYNGRLLVMVGWTISSKSTAKQSLWESLDQRMRGTDVGRSSGSFEKREPR